MAMDTHQNVVKSLETLVKLFTCRENKEIRHSDSRGNQEVKSMVQKAVNTVLKDNIYQKVISKNDTSLY